MSTLASQLSSISVIQGNNLPFNADAVQLTNPDINGNYQTVKYFKDSLTGTLITTLNITYDASSNVTTAVKV